MKNILFILYFIIYSCTPAFGAATTTITADSIRSSNRTKTWTPPSITDVLTGLTDVQTLTNKTLTSPTINTPLVDVDTFTEQGSTPSTPAAGKRKVYAKADGIYHLDSAGNERKVGSGSGGGDVSYITNGNADDANASIFVPYADAAATRPVDGTGGTTTGATTALETVSPIDGTKSFKISKDAANRQGLGFTIPFTLPEAYQSRQHRIYFDYKISSGTFIAGTNGTSPTDGDLIVYIAYLDPADSQWKLIEPSNFKFLSNTKDYFTGEFQTHASATSYRLIFHIASTSTSAWDMLVDNIAISPNKASVGSLATKDQSYVPTFTGFGTVASTNILWQISGGKLKIRGLFTTGTTAASGATFSLPAGLVGATTSNTFLVGRWSRSAAATNHGGFLWALSDATTIYFSSADVFSGASTTPTTQANGNAVAGTGETIYFEAELPLKGIEPTTRQSDGYDGREISFFASKTSNQSITANTTNVSFTNIIKDSVGGWNGTDTYTVKSAGSYLVGVNGGSTTTNTNAQVYINGNLYAGIGAFSSDRSTGNLLIIPDLKANETITIRGSTTTTVNGDANKTTTLSIVKVQAPQTISSSEVVAASYTIASSGTVQLNTSGPINFATKVDDTHNAVTASSGGVKFTAPISGRYRVSTGLRTAATCTISLYKNGSSFISLMAAPAGTNTAASKTIILNAGDNIDLRSNVATTTQDVGYFDVELVK